MGRWQPDSRGRLQEAALTLFAQRGFDQTTAAEIADRAGLTERTFFRYFADKREVLFGGSEMLQKRVIEAVEAAPPGAAPLEAVVCGLRAAAAMLGDSRRDLTRLRFQVIAANPDLRERDLAKMAGYAAAITAVLVRRGVPATQAAIAAHTGITLLGVALRQWLGGDEDVGLRGALAQAIEDLRVVTAPS